MGWRGVEGREVNEVLLYFQYGYSKYGGWAVQGATMVFAAAAALRGVMPPLPTAAAILAGLVLGFLGMVWVGKRMVLTERGLAGLEHAMLTARNPVWRQYLMLAVKAAERDPARKRRNGGSSSRPTATS